MKPSLDELINDNVSDPVVREQIHKNLVKKARTSALLLGSVLIVALGFTFYAYSQKINVEKLQIEISAVQKEIDLVKSEYEKQVALATEAKIIAEEAARLSYEQLQDCRNKK